MIIQYYLDVLNISSTAKVNTSSWTMLFVLNTFFHSCIIPTYKSS